MAVNFELFLSGLVVDGNGNTVEYKQATFVFSANWQANPFYASSTLSRQRQMCSYGLESPIQGEDGIFYNWALVSGPDCFHRWHLKGNDSLLETMSDASFSINSKSTYYDPYGGNPPRTDEDFQNYSQTDIETMLSNTDPEALGMRLSRGQICDPFRAFNSLDIGWKNARPWNPSAKDYPRALQFHKDRNCYHTFGFEFAKGLTVDSGYDPYSLKVYGQGHYEDEETTFNIYHDTLEPWSGAGQTVLCGNSRVFIQITEQGQTPA